MRKTVIGVLAITLVGSVAAWAGDTSSSGNVPKIIRILREDIKIGKMAAHDNLVRQVRQQANRDNANFFWVSGRPITGNTSEFVAVGFFDSFADIDRANEAFDKVVTANYQNADFARDTVETHQSMRTVIGRLRQDLSYNTQKFDIANATRWEITLVRVKPGTESDLADSYKELIDLHRRGNIDENWAVYEVAAGGPGPAFVVLQALRSLADLDVDRMEAHKAAISPQAHKRFEAAVRDSVIFEETSIISVRPEISRPPQSVVAANPDYWTVKEVAPAAASASRGKRQKSGVQPATLKENDRKK